MQKKIKKISYIAGCLLILITGGIFFLFYPYHYVLYFQDPYTKELLAYLPVEDEEQFQIKYTHSIHLSDVYEGYKVEDEVLYPVELIYEDTAIGMPANAEEGEVFNMKDGKYYISNLQGQHKTITLAVGKVRANHAIIHQGQSYELKEYVGAGTIVTIAAGRMTNWKLLKGVEMNESRK